MASKVMGNGTGPSTIGNTQMTSSTTQIVPAMQIVKAETHIVQTIEKEVTSKVMRYGQGLHFIGDHLKGPDPVGDHSADDADNYGRDIESSNE